MACTSQLLLVIFLCNKQISNPQISVVYEISEGLLFLTLQWLWSTTRIGFMLQLPSRLVVRFQSVPHTVLILRSQIMENPLCGTNPVSSTVGKSQTELNQTTKSHRIICLRMCICPICQSYQLFGQILT